MELQSTFLLGLLLVLGCAVTSSGATNSKHSVATCSAALLNRSSFPEGFLFGAAGSAYQVPLSLMISLHNLGFSLWVLVRCARAWFGWLCVCCVCMDFSMKVLQMKVVEDQVYGIHSLTNIQVYFSYLDLFFFVKLNLIDRHMF